MESKAIIEYIPCAVFLSFSSFVPFLLLVLPSRSPDVFRGHEGDVLSAVFSPDGNRILTTSRDKTARIWDLNGNELAILRGHKGIVWSASFSPDGSRILTASWDMTVRMWLANTEDLLALAEERAFRRSFTPAERSRYAELLGE